MLIYIFLGVSWTYGIHQSQVRKLFLKAYPTDLLESTSPVSLVICGAPYKQVPSSNFKGSSELQDVGGNASTKKWSAAR